MPKGADTKDTKAIKRLATGFLKLLFPHIIRAKDIGIAGFEENYLKPAKRMRSIIRKQFHIMDHEYPDTIPEIKCAGGS